MVCANPKKESGTIDFGRGVPSPEAFPTQQLQECAKAVLEREGSVVLQYYPAAGYVPLRGWLADRYGVATECVLVSNGSLQILDFLSFEALANKDGSRVNPVLSKDRKERQTDN